MPNNDALNPEIVGELLNDCAVKKAEFDASLAAFHASQAQLRVSMSDAQYRLQRAMNSADSKLRAQAPALARAYLQQAEENTRLREAVEWYGEQARLCRLIHAEGDVGRHALANDGGRRARALLTPEGQP